jgi:hypothetical protein
VSISMYLASVPVFIRGLTNLKGVLEKAQAHAAAKKIADPVFVNARLYPDMLPLSKQVQIASDFARGTTARLAGEETPAWEDNEATLAELIARVDKTIAFVQRYGAAAIDGSEGKSITRPIRGQPVTFTGIDYLLRFALPNFYFHTSIAYAILRHNGVEIGKADFLGPIS